ncbi:uncharacterized protein LOC112056527 [Bicyclus anynana]|uniref:Uncharacterized protein LOC112056527 n=1 Tax=Bicyclus anynana TaxID=110368 RepID=A0A6J1P4L1_BICAN|nr:uncharacterized protein LOC112056527 [Bicyclus anynana]
MVVQRSPVRGGDPPPTQSRAFRSSLEAQGSGNITIPPEELVSASVRVVTQTPPLECELDKASVGGDARLSPTPPLSLSVAPSPSISQATVSPKGKKKKTKATIPLFIELPAHSEDVKDIDSFVAVVNSLTHAISQAVNEGKSVTANNKKVVTAAAAEIQKATAALVRLNSEAPLPSSVESGAVPFDKDSLVTVIRQSIREELKSLPTAAPSLPPLTKSFAAAVAATPPKRQAARTLPSIIIKADETSDHQPVVYDEWRKHVSFRDTTFAPTKVKTLRQNMLKVEFETIEQRDATLTKAKKIPGIIAEETKLRRPLIILRGISKEVQREELTQIISQQNEINVEDLRLCFLLRNRNEHLYNAVLEVAPAVRRKLVEGERANVEHQRVHVADFSRFVQCYKCLQFGHTNGKCTADFYPCAHCGSTEHHAASCPVKSNPDKLCCYNCTQSNTAVNVKHSALDTKSCPKIIKVIKSLEDNTDYGY